MSRQIDITKPLTEDEVKYLEDRDRYYDLEMNKVYVAEAQAADPKKKSKTAPPASPTDEE